MNRGELKLVGGKDNVQDSRPVVGKESKNSGGRPDIVLKLFDQYSIGWGGRSRFMEDVSKMSRGIFR